MAKELKHDREARDELANGVKKLAKAVKSTLGPAGRTVIIEKPFGPPTITKDGVTVAKETLLRNKFEELGARLVREAASQTNESAGDGTTTATVLVESMLQAGMLAVDRGVNPIKLKQSMEKARDKAIEIIRKYAKDVSDFSDIEKVATISANNDKEIGKIIAEAFKEVGEDGVITTEDSQSMTTSLALKEGMDFDKGLTSPYFVTDEKRGECVMDNAIIVIIAGKLTQQDHIIPIADFCKKSNRPVLIMADGFSDIIMRISLINKVKGLLELCLVENPSFGPDRINGLKDIATMCGGKVIDTKMDVQLDKLSSEQLKEYFGTAEKVTVSKTTTTIVGGAGNHEDIEARAKFLQKSIEECDSEYQAENLRKRLAKLTGGVARIDVGGSTEAEVNEKKMRIEDALYATKAATEEGVVPGGGTIFLKAFQEMEDRPNDFGYNIIKDSLKQVTSIIVENAGENGDVVIAELFRYWEDDDSYGKIYDALEKKYVDPTESNVLDPAKVCICALATAVSVVTLLLTTNTAIIEHIEEKSNNYGSPGLPPAQF